MPHHLTEDAEELRIAAILFGRDDDVDIDGLLADVVARLQRDGYDVTGILQSAVRIDPDAKPSVGVREIRDGWQLPILENRGLHSRGCRLDPVAITEVARRLDAGLDRGADLVVVNRFGKAEAEGGGLRPVLERAFVEGIAVLVAVRRDFTEQWEAFHGGMAEMLAPDADAVLGWCRTRCRAAAAAE